MTIPKFRAWDVHEKKMFSNAQLIVWNGNVYANDNSELNVDNLKGWSIDEKYLMQSTGLIDKNGKEVFENDVIRDSDGFEGIVQYDESYGMYGIAYLPTLSNGIDMTFEELKDNFRNKFEVIGNIYENPELVENNNGISKKM